MGPASAASALATDGPRTPAASRWDGLPRSDEKHPSGLQARLSKGMADYDDLFQAEEQTTALIPWPTVCGRSDGRVEGRRHPDDCCVPPLETAVVATSTSPELCSDGTRPVTIVYVSLATRTHPTSPVSYCVSHGRYVPEMCTTARDVQLIRYVRAYVENPSNGKSKEVRSALGSFLTHS